MESAADRLKALRQKRYKSAAAAARAMGIPAPTYSSHENTTRGIPIDAAKRYAKFYRVSLDYLLSGTTQKQPMLENDLTPLDLDVGFLPVRGEVRAGAWLEEDGGARYEGQTIRVLANPKYKPDAQFALKVVGDSMDKVVKDGEYVVCVDFAAVGRMPEDGEIVVVQKHRHGLMEVTLKRYIDGSGRIELRPESNNPAYRSIFIDEGNPNEDVQVVALVEGSYRSLKQ